MGENIENWKGHGGKNTESFRCLVGVSKQVAGLKGDIALAVEEDYESNMNSTDN